MSQTFKCPGCGGTTDSREMMERHQAGCVLALRARIDALTARVHQLEDDYQCARNEAEMMKGALNRRG